MPAQLQTTVVFTFSTKAEYDTFRGHLDAHGIVAVNPPAPYTSRVDDAVTRKVTLVSSVANLPLGSAVMRV